MAWSTIYVTILMSHSEEWLTAKKQAASRAKLLAAVAKEIIAHREENHPDEGPLLNLEKVGLTLSWPIHKAHQTIQKIMTWYQNNVKAEQAEDIKGKGKDTRKGVKSYRRNYTAKGVAKTVFKDLISEHIQDLTDEKPGSPGWLKHYPAAHAAVFEGLNRDQLKECEELAQEWNSTGPNEQEQAK